MKNLIDNLFSFIKLPKKNNLIQPKTAEKELNDNDNLFIDIKSLSDKNLKEITSFLYFNIENYAKMYPEITKKLKYNNLIEIVNDEQYMDYKYKISELKTFAKQFQIKTSQTKSNLIKALLENKQAEILQIISKNKDYKKICCINKDFLKQAENEINYRKEQKLNYKNECINQFLLELNKNNYDNALKIYLKWNSSLPNFENSFTLKETEEEFIKRNTPILKIIFFSKKPDILDFLNDDDLIKIRIKVAIYYYFKEYYLIDSWNYKEYSCQESIDLYVKYVYFLEKIINFQNCGVKKVKLICISNCECCKNLLNKEIPIEEIKELPRKECDFECRICNCAMYSPIIDF